jgi:methyl-CpG-binding domain protein 4
MMMSEGAQNARSVYCHSMVERSFKPLLQELHADDPWKVLVICLMLNCTRRAQVDAVIDNFFSKWSSASQFIGADDADVKETIKSLGFYNRRTKALKKMSIAYITGDWSDVRDLPGVGEYAARAFEMFVLNEMGDVEPKDHALSRFWRYVVKGEQ